MAEWLRYFLSSSRAVRQSDRRLTYAKRRVTRNHMGSPAQVRVLLVSIFDLFSFSLFVQMGLTCDPFWRDCGLGFVGGRYSGEGDAWIHFWARFGESVGSLGFLQFSIKRKLIAALVTRQGVKLSSAPRSP